MDLSLIVPTYNERENLPALLERIGAALTTLGIEGEVLLVDDGSPDGTAAAAESLATPFRLQVIQRGAKLGLGTAVTTGFAHARGDVVAVLDADLSHPPEAIVDMYLAILAGAELAIGSRKVEGGKTEGWTPRRHLTSWGATVLARPLSPVKDPMSGFFMVRREVLERAELRPRGYKVLLEILVRCRPEPVTEVPIHFVDRRAGASKLTLGLYGTYAGHALSLYPVRWPFLAQLPRFAFVGLLGVLVNLAVLFLLVELADVWYLIAAAIAFSVAVTSNFYWNRRWTFRSSARPTPPSDQYARFFAVSVLGLAVNLAVLSVFVTNGVGYLTGQLIAIGAATGMNFTGSKYLAFRP